MKESPMQMYDRLHEKYAERIKDGIVSRLSSTSPSGSPHFPDLDVKIAATKFYDKAFEDYFLALGTTVPGQPALGKEVAHELFRLTFRSMPSLTAAVDTASSTTISGREIAYEFADLLVPPLLVTRVFRKFSVPPVIPQ